MRQQDIRRFLAAAFEFKDPSHWIQVCQFSPTRIKAFLDLEQAIKYVEQHHVDIYVARGLSAKNLGAYHRATEGQVAAVIGFCLELDYKAGPKAHKHANLPSQAEALTVLKEMPLPASFLIHSGHGYHSWHLFKEPFGISTEKIREEIKWVSQQWGETLRQLVKSHGYEWKVDSVFDLSRVMRVPGTENHKEPEKVMDAYIEEESEFRAESLEPFYTHIRTEGPLFDRQTPQEKQAEFVIDLAVIVPVEKYIGLLSNDARFAKAIAGSGQEGWSPSEYDMSLADACILAGWGDQDTVDLIIDRRRGHGATAKTHQSYYQHTIAAAHKNAERAKIASGLVGAMTEVTDRGEKIERLCKLLGFSFERVVRYQTRDGGNYYIVIEGQHVYLGDVSHLIEQRLFRKHIADAVGLVLPFRKGGWWDPIAQGLRAICEEYEVGEESSLTIRAQSWVDQYLEAHPPRQGAEDVIQDTLLTDEPILKDGLIYLRLGAFCRWVNFMFEERLTAKTLGAWLRILGVIPDSIRIRLGNGRLTTRYVWRLTEEMSRNYIEEEEVVDA